MGNQRSVETMSVPLPIAMPEASVLVLNYRKRPAEWETGIVSNAAYELRRDGGGEWSYHVRLDRRSPRGTYMHLHVGNESVRA